MPSPVAITAGTLYVVSYHASAGFYSGEDGYFATTGVDNGPLHAPRDGTEGSNGVYRYGAPPFQIGRTTARTTGSMLCSSRRTVRYHATDGSLSHADRRFVRSRLNSVVTATSTRMCRTSRRRRSNCVTRRTRSSRPRCRTPPRAAPGRSPRTLLSRTRARTRPPERRNGRHHRCGGQYTCRGLHWTFTTAAPPPPPPNDGPGGPILVIGSSRESFSRYHAEILRAEGLNAFFATDITQVSAATLTAYNVVILGDIH